MNGLDDNHAAISVMMLGGIPYLVQDTFADVNGTALADHTPNRAPAGSAWTAQAGTWAINSNQLDASSGDGDHATIDSGIANSWAEAAITRGTQTAMGIIIRWSATTAFWLCQMNFSSGQLEIYDNDNGFTVRAVAAVTWNDGDILRFEGDGNVLTGYQNGTSRVTFTSAFSNTATEHGVRAGGTQGDGVFDDFQSNNV